MANPPPMADQFLHDLRKMIAIAKQRITLRRHIPKLSIIAEEDESVLEIYTISNVKNESCNTQQKLATVRDTNIKPKYYAAANSARNANIFKANYDFSYLYKNNLKILNTSLIDEKDSPKSAKSLSDDSGRDTSAEVSSSSDGASSAESASPATTPPPVQKSTNIGQKYGNSQSYKSNNSLQDVEETKNPYFTQMSE